MALGSRYLEARQQTPADASYVTWIDGFPYFPFCIVEETDESIVAMVTKVLQISSGSLENDLPKDPIVHVVSGGATNRLYRVEQYLIRLFGAEGLIDRDEETYYYTRLSHQSLAPKFYGRFANGRMEQFLPNMRTIATDEMSQFAIPIATAMAKLHTGLEGIIDMNAAPPSVWIQLDSWLLQAEALQRDCNDADDGPFRLADIRIEFDVLKRAMKQYKCRVGFCHNDILPANVLVSKDGAVQLIDFEYGGINYCSFDIANHWNEYAGGPPDCTDPDYSKLPDLHQQRDFLRAYGDQDLLDEVHFFLRVNHFYWGLWAVVQAGTEGCETYDYRRYAIQRINQYFSTKRKESIQRDLCAAK